MSVKILNTFEKDSRMLRDGFSTTIKKLLQEDKDVCYLDADLMSCLGTKPTWKEFPSRVYNVGIAEANMVGIAAGLSATGKKPFIHSFGTFASRRCMDQLFMSVAYAKLNVRVIGSDPGVTAAFNGGTHMPFEDMGVVRVIPSSILLEPCDYAQLVDLLEQSKDMYGLIYIRMPRKNQMKIYEDGSSFKVGKGVILKDGTDVTIVSSGIMVYEAILAAEKLALEGISARVVDMFTWKPIDNDLLKQCAQETGCIVTAENHNVMCGLGSAVAESIVKSKPVPIEMVGIQDEFGEVGPEDYLRDRFNLNAAEIIRATKEVIKRK